MAFLLLYLQSKGCISSKHEDMLLAFEKSLPADDKTSFEAMKKAAGHLPDLDSFKRQRVKDSMRIYSQKANPKHIQKSFERIAALRFLFFRPTGIPARKL